MALTQEEIQQYRQRYGLDKGSNTDHEARMARLRNITREASRPLTKDEQVQKPTNQTAIGEVAEGAGKGILNTARNVSKFVSKIGDYIPDPIKKIGKQIFPNQAYALEGAEKVGEGIENIENKFGKPGELTTPQNNLEKIGFYGEQIAEYLIPGGTSTKIANAASRFGKTAKLAGRVAGEVAEGLTVTGFQTGGDIQEMKKDAYFSAALPLFGATFRKAGKVLGLSKGKGALSTTGEILTGIEADKLDKWYNLAKQSPERIKAAKEIITNNPTNPYTELARGVGEALASYKNAAKKAFDEAVETVKFNNPSKVFNLSENLPVIENTLNKYNLGIVEGTLKPLTRTSPFTKQELGSIGDIVKKIQTPDMTVDELLDLDASIKVFMDDAMKKDNKKLIALGGELIGDSAKLIDNALPEINDANKMYRTFYKAMDNGGQKFINSKGELKTSAEGFIKNVFNKNKGEQLKQLKTMEESLGIKILDNVEDIKLANEMMSTVPLTVKNRTVDIIRGIVSSKTFGGGAMAGGLINPVVALPAVMLNLLSSPRVYSGLIEAIAGKSKNTPVKDVLKSVSKEELNLFNNLLQGIFAQLSQPKTEK